MNRKLNAELIDEDNPEWVAEDFKQAMPLSGLPKTLQTKLERRARGAQLTATKERITIRLSPTVVESFRATGTGWQTRMDAALQDWLSSHAL